MGTIVIILGVVAFVAYSVGEAKAEARFERHVSERVARAVEASEHGRRTALRLPSAPESYRDTDVLTQQIMEAQNEQIRQLREQLRGAYGHKQA